MQTVDRSTLVVLVVGASTLNQMQMFHYLGTSSKSDKIGSAGEHGKKGEKTNTNQFMNV